MFGLLRTTLALMVMVYHLFIGVLPLGTYAVFGFYIISGYLMTLIMHESYGYTSIGRYSFAINRLLRLYPQYWAAASLSIILIIIMGADVTTSFHKSIYIPVSIKDVLHNLFMAFTAWYPNSINPRLVPPTWALTVEIFFYILICLGISKTLFRVKLWLFVSFCYVIFSYVAGWGWQARYFPVAAASLPFAIGAAIFFLSKNARFIERFNKFQLSARSLYFLFLSNCLIWIFLSRTNIGSFVEIGFYLNIVFGALLLYSLVRGGKIFAVNKKIDKIIGDYSYPVYLLHWQSGLIASYVIFGEGFHEFSIRGFISLMFAILIVTALSTMFIYGLDGPIQRVRKRIKANKSLQRTLVPRAAEL
jgi:peptidoglycan/LPS O-acetylase OafA/YrhL